MQIHRRLSALQQAPSIIHPHQAQPLRRRGVPGLRPVLRFERLPDALRRALALSDLQKRSGQDAHHVLQEARAVVIEINIVFPPDDLDGIDDPHGGFFHLRVRAEAFVIMLAGEIFRCALHGGKIGLVIEHGDVFAVKELAFIYLVVFILMYIAGPGKFSIDHIIGNELSRRKSRVYKN